MPLRRLAAPSAVDLAIVGALAAWGVVEALALEGPGSPAERVGWALATTLPLLFRRGLPLTTSLVLSAAVLARMAVAEGGGIQEEGAMPFPAILVAAFSAAVHTRTLRDAAIALAVLYGVTATVFLSEYFTGDPQPSDWVVLTFFVVASASAGLFLRRRTIRGELAAQEAVLDERTRISRELHDIIGHSVSAIALQAAAAEQLLRRDPDKAAEHLGAVQRSAREALVEMRRLMGVLREDDAEYRPAPGLATLDALVERAREAGMEVDVHEEGERGALAAGVDLAAYRIVQEALTNARKHAGPVRASVRIAYEPGAVDLVVDNEEGAGGNGDRGGAGLAGASERARLFGGTLDAAPRPGGGFRVHARLPTEAPR